MKTGIVFDIKRFAIHDGPGIRTTVFMKGCPLRCLWCHNPEGLEKRPFVDYINTSYIQCGICVEVCPGHCIERTPDGVKTNFTSCILCGRCVEECPTASRKITGVAYTPDQLFQEIVKDMEFYRAGGGGVTFSGGEAMEQTGFIVEVMNLCQKAGIHIVLDTSGYAFCKAPCRAGGGTGGTGKLRREEKRLRNHSRQLPPRSRPRPGDSVAGPSDVLVPARGYYHGNQWVGRLQPRTCGPEFLLLLPPGCEQRENQQRLCQRTAVRLVDSANAT